MATDKQISTIVRHFLIAAIWSECPEGTHPRVTKEATERATRYVTRFVADIGPLFDHAMECESEGYGSHPDAGSPEAAFGHDLWLSSGGHGVGFSDREALEAVTLHRGPFMDRNGKPYSVPVGSTIGEALHAAAYGGSSGRIGYYECRDASFYRGWLYLSGTACNEKREYMKPFA